MSRLRFRKLLSPFVALFIPCGLHAQDPSDDLCPLVSQSGGPLQVRPGALGTRSNITAPQVVRDLENYSGLPPNFFTIWPSRDARVQNNAAAQACFGQAYIFYDDRFFAQTPGQGTKDWIKYFIFAHEVGHHQLNHFAGSPKPRVQKELEADEWAGFALGRMGADLTDLTAAVDFIQPSEQPLGEYPGRCQRREAVMKGYNRAAGQLGRPTGTFLPPCGVARLPANPPVGSRLGAGAGAQDLGALARRVVEQIKDISADDLSHQLYDGKRTPRRKNDTGYYAIISAEVRNRCELRIREDEGFLGDTNKIINLSRASEATVKSYADAAWELAIHTGDACRVNREPQGRISFSGEDCFQEYGSNPIVPPTPTPTLHASYITHDQSKAAAAAATINQMIGLCR